MRPPLTFKNALETNRLDEFIAQEEARGVGPEARAEVEALLRSITSPRPRTYPHRQKSLRSLR